MSYLLKRLLCVFGVHWSGRTDGGAMGDAMQCDICGLDAYDAIGVVIHDRSKDNGH